MNVGCFFSKLLFYFLNSLELELLVLGALEDVSMGVVVYVGEVVGGRVGWGVRGRGREVMEVGGRR